MSLTGLLALPLDPLPLDQLPFDVLPFDVLAPGSPSRTTEPGSGSGIGTAGVVGVIALSGGVIVLPAVLAWSVVARRRRQAGGQIGGPQWNR
jgi:hypothetical protein